MNSTDKLLNSNCNEHRITISGSNEEKTVLILLNASNDSTKIVKKKVKLRNIYSQEIIQKTIN